MFNKILTMAFVALIGSGPAYAASYDFSARIDQVNEVLPVGTIINGKFSYADNLIPSVIYPVEKGQVVGYDDPSINLSVLIAGFTYTGHASAFVANDAGSDGDGFGLTTLTDAFVLQFSFDDPTGSTFAHAALPTTALPMLAMDPRPDPNDDDDLHVPLASFTFVDLARGKFFDSTVLFVSPTASAVPELPTWAMLITGFGLIGGSLRRQGRLAAR